MFPSNLVPDVARRWRRGRWTTKRVLAPILFVALFCSDLGYGQTLVGVSPDVTINWAGVVTADEDATFDNGFGLVARADLGSLPAGADVIAYAVDPAGGTSLMAFETAVDLGAGVVARPGDVVKFDGFAYSLEFEAASEGLSPGARVDAVAFDPSGLILSFDTTVALGGLVADDEDLVFWQGPGTASVVLDGSGVGMPPELDVDAFEFLPDGRFLLSFDTAGALDNIRFDDDDLVTFNGNSFEMYFDGEAVDSDWRAADVDAVPEPAVPFAIALAVGALVAMRRAR